MIGNYELWLDHWDGTRLAYLDSWLNLEYTRALHNVGALSLQMPSSFDDSLLKLDYKIEVWRALPGQSKRLENVYLLRGWKQWTDEHGVNYTTLFGVDGNDILKRRTVVGQANDSLTRRTGLGGNILKAYMRAALTASVGSTLTMPAKRAAIATYFTVAADANEWSAYSGSSPSSSFTKNYIGKTLFDVAEGICGTSTGRGYPLWWYVMPLSGTAYQFRTYATLMGQDRSAAVIISTDNGLVSPVHEFDASAEVTVIWGLGHDSAVGDYRIVSRFWDNVRYQRTPFSYHEAFLDCGTDYSGAMDERIQEALGDADSLPSEIFTCQINDVENLRYGRDWDLGDRIGFSYRGVQDTAVVRLVYVKVGKTEEIYTQFEIETTVELGS